MKRKELRELARKIAKAEKKLQSSELEPSEKRKLEEEIVFLTSHVDSLEDMLRVDEFVQDILEKNS